MEHANESTLLWIYIAITFIIPAVCVIFDDAKVHGK